MTTEKEPLLQHAEGTSQSQEEPLLQHAEGTSQSQECNVPNPLPQQPEGTKQKKKKFKFLDEEIKVLNPDDIEYKDLLSYFEARFESRAQYWERRTLWFKMINFFILTFVIGLQIFQVVIMNISDIPTSTQKLTGSVGPAISSGVIVLQSKVKLDEKSRKCKAAAAMYNKMLQVARYRIQLFEAGGIVEDIADLWNDYLKTEVEDIPGLVLPM